MIYTMLANQNHHHHHRHHHAGDSQPSNYSTYSDDGYYGDNFGQTSGWVAPGSWGDGGGSGLFGDGSSSSGVGF